MFVLQLPLVGSEINTTNTINSYLKKIQLITKFEQFAILPSTMRSTLSIRGRRILSLI